MAITSTQGVVSNLDYQGLMRQLISIRKQPLKELEKNEKELKELSSAYTTLNAKIDAIRSAADDLRSETSFNQYTSDVSDTTLLGATAAPTASKGTYDIVINSLAQAHKIAADGVASEDTVISSVTGSFKFTVGAGAEQTVAVDATTTLADLRTAINDLDAGVTASIINDGDPTNPSRLVLTSEDTGTANAISITQNDTSLAFNTTLQAAGDADFTVDGMAITKSTNTVSDVITGVTLDLKSASASTVTLDVDHDIGAIKGKVESLVDAYNAAMTYIRENNRYDSENKESDPFFGDVVARSIGEDLRRKMTTAVSGLPDDMNRLIHAGISSDKYGAMTVDGTKLREALETRFDDVVNLFVSGDTTEGIGSLVYDTADSITDYAEGRIKNKQNGIEKSLDSIEMSIRRKERDIDDYESRLRDEFTALETMIATMKSQSNFLNGM